MTAHGRSGRGRIARLDRLENLAMGFQGKRSVPGRRSDTLRWSSSHSSLSSNAGIT